MLSGVCTLLRVPGGFQECNSPYKMQFELTPLFHNLYYPKSQSYIHSVLKYTNIYLSCIKYDDDCLAYN